MSYTSSTYLLFLVAVFCIYYIIRPRHRMYVLLVANVIFYLAAGFDQFLVLLLATAVSYVVACKMGKLHEKLEKQKQEEGLDRKQIKRMKANNKKQRKRILIWGLVLNIGILVVFKYTNFLLKTGYSILDLFGIGHGDDLFKLIMPLGISFFTFQILSYLIEHKLKLNDKLPSEEELTELFGVSRVSVREGLRGLKFLGLVESSTRGGTRIRQVDFSILSRVLGFQIAVSDLSYFQLLEARLSIELGVLDIIIDKITPQQLDELRALADCARYDDTPEEIERNYHRDCEFHRKLLEISENQVLIAFSNLLEIFFTRRSASAEASQAGAREHFQIVEALETGNLELARGIMRSHLRKYKEGGK